MSDGAHTSLVKVDNLKVHFPLYSGQLIRSKHGAVRAVDGVSFDIGAGETVGLVGESGCGKSTLGRALLRLEKHTAGTVMFRDHDISRLSGAALRRSRVNMQMVFQDPFAALNSRMRILDLVQEPLVVHGKCRSKKECRQTALDLLDSVGFNPNFSDRYPTAFSGGQRQRVCIARALATDPEFLVCDEAVSALDVSIQAQIINLLSDLQAERNLSYLFVSHDLSVIRHISNRVLVMYLGKIVEQGKTEEVFSEPSHPYTKALLDAVPVPDPEVERGRKRIYLSGELPNPANPPKGCNFCTRCPYVMNICHETEPPLRKVAEGRHVACHLHDPDAVEQAAQTVGLPTEP